MRMGNKQNTRTRERTERAQHTCTLRRHTRTHTQPSLHPAFQAFKLLT